MRGIRKKCGLFIFKRIYCIDIDCIYRSQFSCLLFYEGVAAGIHLPDRYVVVDIYFSRIDIIIHCIGNRELTGN